MATVTMKELLEAGVHFGHQVRRWNPKMKEYIFGERNGIYIIDLQKTQKLFRDALNYVQEAVTERPNMKVLFVGTKRQAQDAIREEAERCGQYYINNRWLGGLMTNFQTVQKSVKKMRDIEAMKADGRFEMLTKKERLGLDKQHEGLMKNLGGIRDMTRLPDMLFIIDVRKEEIAVLEANRLNIPVVAVVDTNCSPDGIDQVIPGNDDALRAIRLFASRIADSILEGQNVGTEGLGLTPETTEDGATAETVEATTEATTEATAEVVATEEPTEVVAEETKPTEAIEEATVTTETAETSEETVVEETTEAVEKVVVEETTEAVEEVTAETKAEATEKDTTETTEATAEETTDATAS